MLPAMTPSYPRVGLFGCPLCRARAGDPCIEHPAGAPGWRARQHHHIERVAVAQAWLGKQLGLFDGEAGG
jgi:hypothetical protein